MLTRSTLPVRSPLPNRQPSTRSAPAISANSAAAVPVPRSLCGWTDSTMLSRRSRWRCIHSIMSAKMFGVLCSTVDGRLMMHLQLRRRCPHSRDCIDDTLAEGQLGAGEHFRRVLEAPVDTRPRRGELLDLASVRAGELDDAVFVLPEHDAAHDGRDRVVDMHDDALGAVERLEGALDQMRTRLRQHLDSHVVGDVAAVDQQAHEIELGLRRGRESRPRSP